MGIEATPDTFGELVADGNVLVDFWGPRCQPCLAMMPTVEALEQQHAGRFRLVKVNAPDNRQVCLDLRVFGLPTYVLYRDGVELERLTGDPSREDLEAAVARLVEGGE